ncbi:MAG: ATP-binding cassette domain-containing protein [Thermotogae bacterium]|nr:ATP-binding cassette domain-containing protein [Thermotogota bacterium]
MKAVEFVKCSVGYTSPVVEGLNLRIDVGEILNLYGDNGVGKTTILKALVGAVSVRGEIKVFNRNILMLKPIERVRYVSVMFAEILRGDITVRRYLSLSLTSVWGEWARYYNINALLDRPLKSLSSGQNRKVQLVRILSSAAPVLALDEPFSHLDEETTRKLKSSLLELHRKGRTIIVTSHRPLGIGRPFKIPTETTV